MFPFRNKAIRLEQRSVPPIHQSESTISGFGLGAFREHDQVLVLRHWLQVRHYPSYGSITWFNGKQIGPWLLRHTSSRSVRPSDYNHVEKSVWPGRPNVWWNMNVPEIRLELWKSCSGLMRFLRLTRTAANAVVRHLDDLNKFQLDFCWYFSRHLCSILNLLLRTKRKNKRSIQMRVWMLACILRNNQEFVQPTKKSICQYPNGDSAQTLTDR